MKSANNFIDNVPNATQAINIEMKIRFGFACYCYMTFMGIYVKIFTKKENVKKKTNSNQFNEILDKIFAWVRERENKRQSTNETSNLTISSRLLHSDK